jgi:hypothetical protein
MRLQQIFDMESFNGLDLVYRSQHMQKIKYVIHKTFLGFI